MIDQHIASHADATIAVNVVPWEEASRFGIMNIDEDNRITEFEEKPYTPKSNLASMGIYIFNWDVLRSYLLKDDKNPHSSNDFGKDVIPLMLAENRRMFSYRFEGYWKDVGTIESLWQANMDLLTDNPSLNLNDASWRIYTVNTNHPPQYIGPDAKITRSLINEGCNIYGEVDHSVLFYGVHVGKGSVIKNSVIMPNVKIGENAKIYNAIIGEDIIIADHCEIGRLDKEITLLEEECYRVNS